MRENESTEGEGEARSLMWGCIPGAPSCTFKIHAHKISLSAAAHTQGKIHFRHLRLVICGASRIGIKLGTGEQGIKENTYTKQKKGLLMTMCLYLRIVSSIPCA